MSDTARRTPLPEPADRPGALHRSEEQHPFSGERRFPSPHASGLASATPSGDPFTETRPGFFLGIDVGSTTVKLVAVSASGQLLAHRYARANGQPRETLLRESHLVERELRERPTLGVGLTGSGGEPVARIIGGIHANELVTQSRAVGACHPEAQTVIEIGGQDSKFLSVRWDAARGQMALLDFAMNTLCAAGTGSFLDQQAQRLGIAIDEEFARIALASRSPARIAGRCTVFAKSDMIHWQQQGLPLSDILAGLCLALARNFTSVIGKGKSFVPPVLFQGGVARNAAVVRAFEEVLGLAGGELVVPEHPDLMPALGAALLAMDEVREGREHQFHGFGALESALRDGADEERSLAPLAPRPTVLDLGACAGQGSDGVPVPVCLGIDVGSISTNVVLLDGDDRVVARRYLPTAGDPIGAVRRGLAEIGEETDGRVRVVGVGATGSGRQLTGYYVGADVVRNEITAQARAAVAAVPDADTVIEI
jgi:predicted CoA-substrate-specific enzyme activase